MKQDILSKIKILGITVSIHKAFPQHKICYQFKFINTPTDVFFRNKEDYEASVEMLQNDENYEEAYKSEKVQAFRHNDGTVIECVKSVFGTPEEVISKFDFTITNFAYWKDESEDVVEYKALFHPQFFEHLMLKKLVIDDEIQFPMSTFNRTYKYAKYGFKPCTETKVKLAKAISKLQEDEITVPENMYDGVY